MPGLFFNPDLINALTTSFKTRNEGIALIDGTTTTASVSSVTISSIPTSFTHLAVFIYSRTTRAASNDVIGMRFNGDTGASNYAYFRMSWRGNSTMSYDYVSSNGHMRVLNTEAASSNSSIFGTGIVFVPFYKSDKHKSTLSLPSTSWDGYSDSSMYMAQNTGIWKSTSVINSVTILSSLGANIASGSKIYVYGVQ